MSTVLGIDVGGSHVSSGLVTVGNPVLDESSLVRTEISPEIPVEEFLDVLFHHIQLQLSSCSTLRSIAFSMPGPFDYKRGISRIYGVGKLDNLFGLNIKQCILARFREFETGEISFTNDAAAMLTGFARRKEILGKALGITLGTGFGSAFLDGGIPLKKGSGIPEGGMLYNQYFEGQPSDDCFSTRWFMGQYEKITGKSVNGVKELAALADTDPLAAEIFHRFGKRLSHFLLPYLVAFDSSHLLVGGSMAGAQRHFLSALQNGFSANGKKIKIQFDLQGEKSAILGAVLDQINRKKDDKTTNIIRRKTAQHLLPAVKPSVQAGKYDIYPSFPIPPGLIQGGFAELVSAANKDKTIIIDGYQGMEWDGFIDRFVQSLGRSNKKTCVWCVDAALKPEKKIQTLTAPYLGEEGSIFGKRFEGRLADFFEPELLPLVGNDQDGIRVIYGCGAALTNHKGLLVYVDLPKNELQFRSRAGLAGNLGLETMLEPKAAYKRYYFIDWIALNKHKEKLLPEIDFIVDAQREPEISFMTGDAFRNALQAMSTSCFRVRPWFEPGPWGGQWIRKNIEGLSGDVPNYAWSFEMIVPENGLLIESDNRLLECSFDFLMFAHAAEVLGHAHTAFGTEFPIRFDFLDTVEGGNLSVQCHPRPEYIKEHFGESFTQDETYYILEADAEATVYLGFQEDIDPGLFRKTLENSHKDNVEVDIPEFVQVHPSRKHDLFLIPGGTIHASGKGNLVLEISSTPYIFTFKMYDWLRLDLEGNPRPLNIEHAMRNLYFDRKGKQMQDEFISKPKVIREGPNFRVFHLPTHPDHFYDVRRLEFDDAIPLETSNRFYVCMLVEGEQVQLKTTEGSVALFNYAETFVIPAAAGKCQFINKGRGRAKIVQAFVKDSFQI